MIVWGAWRGQDERDPPWDGSTWQTLSVQCYAEGQHATLWIRSECRHRAKHNDVYLDSVELAAYTEDAGGGGGGEEPGELASLLGEVIERLQILNVQLATLIGVFRTPD